MLAVKRSAGVAPEVNLRNPLCAGKDTCKQGIYPDFETQGRLHQKSTTGVSVTSQKGLESSKKNFLFKIWLIQQNLCDVCSTIACEECHLKFNAILLATTRISGINFKSCEFIYLTTLNRHNSELFEIFPGLYNANLKKILYFEAHIDSLHSYTSQILYFFRTSNQLMLY